MDETIDITLSLAQILAIRRHLLPHRDDPEVAQILADIHLFEVWADINSAPDERTRDVLAAFYNTQGLR